MNTDFCLQPKKTYKVHALKLNHALRKTPKKPFYVLKVFVYSRCVRLCAREGVL